MKSLFSITLTILITSIALMAQNMSTIPNLDQTERITFQSLKTGWMLDIYPDGSGRLLYGSSFGDEARIAKQTFSFRDVYNLLVPHLVKDSDAVKAMAVVLRPKTPAGPVYALYLEDKSIIKKIMSEARDKGVPLYPERFKELVTKHSPVPDETQSTSQ